MKTFIILLAAFMYLHANAEDGHIYNYTSIEGNRIAWSCEGNGSPTIALIAGGGLDAHTSFSRTYHNYDGPGKICLYERAGMGESTFEQPRTRTLAEMADELHQLSTKENWGELVLVAHSFGGFIARQYTSDNPENVLAMVLLDVAQEDWIPNLQKTMKPEDWAIMDAILKWNTTAFHEDYIQSQEAVRKTKINRTLPITVVSRGLPHTKLRSVKVSYDGIRKFNIEHDAGQLKLLNLSTNAKYVIADVASHMIDEYDPWLVIEEIKLMLKRVEN